MRHLLWSLANTWDREYRLTRRYIRHYVGLTPVAAAAESRRRLHRYLEYCRIYSPYWKERWPREIKQFAAEEAEDVLALLPPLTKHDLHQYADELRIRPESRKPDDGFPPTERQTPVTSGGSTGMPATVWIDAHLTSRTRASLDYFYQLCGARPGDPMIWIWGSPNELRDVQTDWRKRLSTWLRGLYLIPAFGLTPERIVQIRDEIARRKSVRSVLSFATTAETVMEYAEREGMEFRRVERVFLGGGLVHERLRNLIRKHLADEVYDVYGGRDIGTLAWETPAHDGLSVLAWNTHVEVLDEAGRRIPDGERGEVHVTMTSNHACAIARYASGDTARWHSDPGRNPVPGPRLTHLLGRTAEHLELPGGMVIDPTAVIHTVGVVISPPWLRKFQLVQRGPERFDLLVERWESTGGDQLDAFEREVRSQLGSVAGRNLDIQVVVVDEIPPSPSGKHLYCRKEFAPEPTARTRSWNT